MIQAFQHAIQTVADRSNRLHPFMSEELVDDILE